MMKRLGVALYALLLLQGSLWAFEDVFLSARALGLGGGYAAVAADAFSSWINPALPARWTRPVTGISAASITSNHLYGSLSYVQPVYRLGSVGGTFFYRDYESSFFESLRESDARFFLAVPAGKRFNFGACLGTHSQEYFSESGNFPLPDRRFAPGLEFALGTAVSISQNFMIGLSAGDFFKSETDPLFSGGVSWTPRLERSSLVSSPLVALNLGLRGNQLKLNAGGELYLFKNHLGLRAGMRYGSDSLSGFSPTFGVSIRTYRIEKTDFEINYAAIYKYFSVYPFLSHELDLVVRFGDARKAEKDSTLAEQTERARQLREQALARERDRLKQELDEIKRERSSLEKERKDIERLRRESLEALAREKGVLIEEDERSIRIILTESALQFESDDAEIPFPRGYRSLDQVAVFLSNYPGKKLVIEAHTDVPPEPEKGQETQVEPAEKEPPKYKDAKALTAARAQMIKSYLVEVKQIPSSLITAEGVGDTRPLEDNSTEEGRAANRRVEITIMK